MYFFMVVLSLSRSVAFSSCGEQGSLSSRGTWASHCCGFSCCGAWTPECWFSSCGAWAVSPWHEGSSLAGDQTHVSCVTKQILNHWTTREDSALILFNGTLWWIEYFNFSEIWFFFMVSAFCVFFQVISKYMHPFFFPHKLSGSSFCI